MKKTAFISALLFGLPLLAIAATNRPDLTYFDSILQYIESWIGALIPMLIGIALIAFFWGLIKYIWGGGSEEARAQGKGIMIAGLVALFIMVSVYGIIKLAQNITGTGGDQTIPVPQYPGI